ncbi:nitrogenase molybdenum-iron protein alpha/beta subunit [Mobilisporobacter senegalensis]|uniref:Nitrogenase molybdenum-iron protein alpha/beta subunit n=1 Tax=Mobilisporobacter senegalensis TaxID=1329262 RepID=A0A3N1XV16_9FIRM|nr:nitrogenase component 1 [Mobilisporobacter senegalensis]ROR30469.1 nitrogenase molybdenum-iron protein alpha/beta subunit [Mobilisporobacter senegalensis]
MIKEDFKFLNRLSDINNNMGIKFLHRAAAPGSHCPMHMALATIRSIKGVSSLVVGMAECGYYSRFVACSPYGEYKELHYVYELDSNEVVFGCRKGVKKALLEMDREGAKVILVIMTCVPALIGEDMESILEEVNPLMNEKAVFIDSAHFKRNGYQSGFSDTLDQLVRTMGKERTEKRKRVNFFGGARGGEFKLLKDMIIQNGYEVSEYARGFSMDDLYRSRESALSIILDRKMLKAGRTLKEIQGIPYVCMADRYTGDDIAGGYEEIFCLLSITNYSELLKGRKLLEKLIQGSKEKFLNISYIATYPELDILPVAMFLSSLGMVPELLHVEEFNEDSLPYKEGINALGRDPYIAYITNKEEILEAFEEPVTLSLGNCQGLERDNIISDSELARMSSLWGFERSQALLDLILKNR